MDERDKTIQSLKERDKKLRESIEQLTYRHEKKLSHAKSGLHDIRVKLTALKWTVQLLSDNLDADNAEHKNQLAAAKHATADLVRMVEDLGRTLEDPA
ncbi:hypothetical protein BK004_03650 [bacterium CG10_46_32]|uniref:Uncharacterized protein n=1 Tax=Candidatus Campbellbacteria bacterium CG22_combo_CG10-13_8_21_14_all_43_18 TaxID=1974530 RepID=A0A2H0DWD3_9BACT|nr:MAG: hypothetical protein BK004_03650 [bacterium CG10_46_32]PIP86301.1 MAG: hypothetical protein COW82_02785 [Candidatus Campbellbacteria bacterium CG22_combo_CG10-13_8_21_14_all_43_18]PIR55893.1 MAG: hypothetical protein COU73_03680 [Parcubacteria group bacterium CG10_big_fil_rev_8_21_14_0_10_46_32]